MGNHQSFLFTSRLGRRKTGLSWRTSVGPSLVETAAFMGGCTPPLRWPAQSIVERSRRLRGAIASAILPRGRRGPEWRWTDSLRAAVTERSANRNRETQPAHPEFEAGKST